MDEMSLLFGEVELMETLGWWPCPWQVDESLLFGEVELMETDRLLNPKKRSLYVASLRRSGINGNC